MEPTPEREPLEVRYFALSELLNSSTRPYLQVLDEFLAVGTQLFQQKALSSSGEDYERYNKMAMVCQKVQSGSYQREKWAFCLATRKIFLEDAEHHTQEGNLQLAEASRLKANNWLELSYACRRIPGGTHQHNVHDSSSCLLPSCLYPFSEQTIVLAPASHQAE